MADGPGVVGRDRATGGKADGWRRRLPLGSLLDGLADGITPEERRHPEVRAELLGRFRRTIEYSSISTFPTVLIFGLVLWPHAPASGILAWAAAASFSGTLWLVILRRETTVAWTRAALALQVWGGLAFGALPLLAMPATVEWQMFVVALNMGVQAANMLFSSQVRRFFYAFHVPHVALSLFAFLTLADGSARWGAVLIGYAGLFAAGLSEIDHLTSLSAAAFGVRNGALAAGLELEREALATANRRLGEQARTDPLTGVANRLEMIDCLGRALADADPNPDGRTGTVVAVAYLDLDGFKAVNDSLGHRAGDLLLVAVTRRLRARLETGEILARPGGDELVVLSPRLPAGRLPDFGGRLQTAFDSPVVLDGRPVEIGASIGVADNTTSSSAGELLRFADAALYRSKKAGEGRPEVFDEVLHGQLQDRMALERDLETAFAADQLVPYLQPVVDMTTGRMVAAEALIRWEHPGGVRSAGVFIGLAAELGLVEAITDRVFTTITDWQFRHGLGPPDDLRIAVNVDPRHLERLLDRFEGTGTLGGLTLEITEESTFASPRRANELIRRAHAEGARVLLDDFGVGFSSLSWALELDVDGYKIDRSFVAPVVESPQARALIAGVVEMARQQDRSVVAEGIETPEQARLLQGIGITLGQGYLYAPAMPITELSRLAVEQRDGGPPPFPAFAVS